jgi:spermidine synthase
MTVSDGVNTYHLAEGKTVREVTAWRGTGIYIFIFFLSGLSGLIYESIWSHYLKLFLGHAAYAQSLVLAIFMGGMAIGSWIAGKRSMRWRNLLVGYALAEGTIGLCALLFHNTFDYLVQTAFTRVIPFLDSVAAVHAFKWGLASLLILPQSILLGMTFPLMSAGILRRYRSHSGETISLLYFANSLGGAIGVLLSGFLLIGLFGLPGTVTTAGLINVGLALVVWSLARNHPASVPPAARAGAPVRSRWFYVLLVAALVTGAASFMYEIAWIRMLSMVLGSSTHAFELMLSAFIFGLAFGGLWIRRRIRNIGDPVTYVAVIQLGMGILALVSLVIYGHTFQVMHGALDLLTRTETGYAAFNLISHGLALLVMLPATFCAGMTLPLMTYALFREGFGEQSIGSIYAANTVGAIIGVVVSVHVLITVIGVKGLIVAGAALDIVLGIVLIGMMTRQYDKPLLGRAVAIGTVALLIAVFGIHPDPGKMASGVYRHGRVELPADTRMLYHRDGKTATISLYENSAGTRYISTNGKPDASIQMHGGRPEADETTMVLAAALPLAHHPGARTVANIGMGSGLTTHALLALPEIESVDTVEIEAAMVEGARGFLPRVELAFSDPRSRIHIEDAKTYFSTRGKQFDLIVSEPSNPWVSGVAGLFTGEFYRSISAYIKDDGLFVQWLQIYEIDTPLVASVIGALSPHFEDYAVYNTDSANILILARKNGKLAMPGSHIFTNPELRKELERVGIRNMQDIQARRIGGRAVLEPLFRSYGSPANSDYFPFLDLNATRSRYLGLTAQELNTLNEAPVPLMEMLDPNHVSRRAKAITPDSYFYPSKFYRRALAVRDTILQKRVSGGHDTKGLPASIENAILTVLLMQSCGDFYHPELLVDSMLKMAVDIIPYLAPGELQPVWNELRSQPCYAGLSPHAREWIALFEQVSRRDGAGMARTAGGLLAAGHDSGDVARTGYLLTTAMLGYLHEKRYREALLVWNAHAPRLLQGGKPNIFLELLYGVAISGRRPAS